MNRDETFWQRKLKAYLHDPPCKALDIANHEQVAASFIKAEFPNFEEVDQAVKSADRLEASIDRFPFPQKKATAEFSGKKGGTFRHPFMDGDNWYEVPKLQSSAIYEQALHDAIGSVGGNCRERFFLYWRRWREEAAKQHSELAFFPADTRIPDHTIWTHLDITAALEGCRNPANGNIEPAFLIFQAGPVQSFVAAARSTRDLWSGSYMLSWLVGHAIKAVTDECGPDAVVFPALRGNGIFDILYKEEIYDKISFQDKDGKKASLWERLYPNFRESANILTNPTLPNRFFAVVPKWRAEELAQGAEAAFRRELEEISEACLQRFADLATKNGITLDEGAKLRWRKQVLLHADITWQCLPVDTDLDSILKVAADLPGQGEKNSQLDIVKRLVEFAQNKMPFEDRDRRYYTDEAKTRLNSWGIAWALNYARTEYLLAARRNTRNFEAFETDDFQAGAVKDALTGVEEAIGSEELWTKLRAPNKDYIRYFFNDNEKCYGAMSIIKRLWCAGEGNYLSARLGIPWKEFQAILRFDSVPDVAKGNKRKNSPYVAVIALDGDEMGKWLSGEKAPIFQHLLAGKASDYFRDNGLAGLQRPLTPSWHLQFSEALSNFSNHVADKVVRHYDGQLIYSGGDDVLAMLPADKALECACALRGLFQGNWDFVETTVPDCGNLHLAAPLKGIINADGTFLVPGCKADVSCGIAIAHANYPLQSMVMEARRAESRAKHDYGRGAVAVSLLKRSGEILHWGAQWKDNAIEVYNQYVAIRNNEGEEAAGGRFPYALAGLLANYSLGKGEFVPGFEARDIILREFDHVLGQQMKNVKDGKQALRAKAVTYLDNLVNAQKERKHSLADFPGLFLMAAFIERNRED